MTKMTCWEYTTESCWKNKFTQSTTKATPFRMLLAKWQANNITYENIMSFK